EEETLSSEFGIALRVRVQYLGSFVLFFDEHDFIELIRLPFITLQIQAGMSKEIVVLIFAFSAIIDYIEEGEKKIRQLPTQNFQDLINDA
ncbi:15046_t:CDS:2, partial [Acaulospora morrowiae]